MRTVATEQWEHAGASVPGEPSDPALLTPAPFVVGASRSGTTLLRLMLDAHPEVAIGPETHFIPEAVAVCRDAVDRRGTFLTTLLSHPRFADHQISSEELHAAVYELEEFGVTSGLRAFYRIYAQRFAKPRWGDKTPQYLRHMALVQEAVPEARFVHLIRDGRDVALSRNRAGVLAADPGESARRWVRAIRRARRGAKDLTPGSYLEVRYEDLVTDPTRTLERICSFVDLRFTPAMLRYPDRAPRRLREFQDLPNRSGDSRRAIHALTAKPPQAGRVAAWRRQMGPEEVRYFESAAGDLLSELGYELSGR